MHLPQIPISWAKRQAAFAVAAGVPIERLFDRALIVPKHDDDRDLITPLQLTLFQAVIVAETNDGSHSMMRHRLDPEIGPIGFRLLLGGANLGDGLAALCKFYDIATRSIRYQLRTDGSHAFLAIQVEEEREAGLLEEDIQLIYLYLGLTRFIGKPFPVSWIATRDHQHLNLDARHYAIGSPVRIGSCAGLAFPAALLTTQPHGGRVDEFRWRPMRDALHMMDTASARDADMISRDLWRADRLAADQSIAPSTLRRKLAREGQQFRQLRENALLEATLDRLGHGAYSVEAIAAELGYADASSLRRFVKRATGRTPFELRSLLGAVVPPAKLYARLEDVVSSLPH